MARDDIYEDRAHRSVSLSPQFAKRALPNKLHVRDIHGVAQSMAAMRREASRVPWIRASSDPEHSKRISQFRVVELRSKIKKFPDQNTRRTDKMKHLFLNFSV